MTSGPLCGSRKGPGRGRWGRRRGEGAWPRRHDLAESIRPAARCPQRWHQRARRRCGRRGLLESCGFFLGVRVGAVLMSAPWTLAPRQVSSIGPRSPPGQPARPEDW